MTQREVGRVGDQARLGELEELERETRRIRDRVAETTGSAESPDGLVEATVGVYGELVELVIDARVYRSPDAEALADSICAAINDAYRIAQSTVRRDLMRTLPSHPATRRLLGSEDPSDLAFEPFLDLTGPPRKGPVR